MKSEADGLDLLYNNPGFYTRKKEKQRKIKKNIDKSYIICYCS